MKLKFDSNLEFQLDAINAVIDLFEGLPPKHSEYEIRLVESEGLPGFNELGIGNQLLIDDEQLLKNLHTVQGRNNAPKSRFLIEEGDAYEFLNFSIEMETGTGKTYVYLRTIFELNRKYGFKKFIIVVPSIAIREGVLKSIEIMGEHFQGLYDNVPFDHFVYNSKDLSKVRQFAVNNEIQIMIINIQAFQKEENIFNKEQDKLSGRSPREFVNATNPFVIIDEPQSVDNTPKSKEAIKLLQPLICFRYSATHINPYNLVYQLDPIKAYDMRLVKQIEVASIQAEEDFNDAFIRIDSIGYAKKAKEPHAKATIYDDTPAGSKEKRITLRQGTDISAQTQRPGYEGYIVTRISAEPGLEHVEFANRKILELYQEEGGIKDDILKSQIYNTVEEHFKKERRFKDKGIKVLSLFFIDRVKNYLDFDEEGNRQKGKIALWFEEAFNEISQKAFYKGLLPYTAEQLHNGYFAEVKKRGRTVEYKDTSGNTIADEEAYELIMKDKERLLTIEEPLRFIFSHSALKEGWDNPNIFQLCSLREMGTERERRQTLGRGLRLPVNQDGERIFDENINKLTVIASESFEEYAKGLQDDIEKDCDIKFGRIDKIAFAKITDTTTDEPIGQEQSERIWQVLVDEGYLDSNGDITDKFDPGREGFKLEIPEEYKPLVSTITDQIKRHIFKNRVVNAWEKRTVKYNKRVELNDGFKELWDKINKKTRYSVEFVTDELVARTVKKIEALEKVNPISIEMRKTDVDISEAGVEGGRVTDMKTQTVSYNRSLPDILAYLQRETELTRNTLVQILKSCGRLKEFTINPQSFMTQVARQINQALNEMIIDGIKYEKIPGVSYEMRLFEEEEIEDYLNNLYEVQSNDNRTPYDYIPFESSIEREVAETLDSLEKVKFFCKLPKWFNVPTPLGKYNPDWAVVTENGGKLYLIRETKSTHDSEKRRGTENNKIKCGKAHFDALGVDFKVATSPIEVTT